MNRHIFFPTMLAAIFAFGGCKDSGDQRGRWVGTIDTLENGAVAVGNPAEGVWPEGGGWQVTEDLRIGALEGDGPDVFGQLKMFAVDDLGQMYIADVQALEIRVFGRDGSHIRTIGREGEGPGEFRGLWGMTIAPDGKLWALDQRNARWSVFDQDGMLDRTFRRDIGSWGWIWGGGFDTEGNLIEFVPVNQTMFTRIDVGLRLVQSGEGRREIWEDTNPEAYDTLGAGDPPPEPEQQAALRFNHANGGRMFQQMPFAARRAIRLDKTGNIWSGFSKEYTLVLTNLAGDTLRIVTRAIEPEDVASLARDSILLLIRETEAQGFRSVDLDETTFPTVRPFFEQITTDDQGGLWVWRRGSDSTTTYDVFDRSGRYLGEVVTPFRVNRYTHPLIRGTEFYGVTQDELEVGYLVRAHIDRN